MAAVRNESFLSLLRSDAGADWERVIVPTLAIFGGKDVQVVAEEEAQALIDALERAGNRDYEVNTLPDANHLFQAAVTGDIGEYGTLQPVFTPDFLPLVIDWIRDVTGLAEAP